MTKLEWKKEMSVGINMFDDEHKKLIDIFNNLHEAITHGQAKHTMSTILAEMTDYATTHFLHEEEVFRKYDYPDLDEHVLEHDHFREELIGFREKQLKGDFDFGIPVFHLLISWIRNHIQRSDKKYQEYLNSKGLY